MEIAHFFGLGYIAGGIGYMATQGQGLSLLDSIRANGKKEKIMRGMEAPEGYRILKGLKALGVDVRDVSDARYLAREAIRDRRADL